MKKILFSFMIIAVAAAVVIGGTAAYFSDTETSTGNTFTAGAIDLKVDSQCSYNGGAMDCVGNWGQNEEGVDITNEKFFSFSDLKPGDYGENTISLHVVNNDARACVIFDNMKDDDLNLTEPEQEDGDNTIGLGNGELSQEINFFAWADDEDNVWEDGEEILFSNTFGPASDVLNGKAYDLGVLPGSETKYIGLYWCYGELTVDEVNHLLSCSGEAVTNVSQSDSLTGDMWFYVQQERNNPNFVCPEPRENDNSFNFASAVGAVVDDEASEWKTWYLRQVGNPASSVYSHNYQWASPVVMCDPNNTLVAFSGTIDVSQMVSGNVSMIGLLDKGLLETGASGYQSGAYLYVYKNSDTNLRIGPSDGNDMNGELIQVFKNYTIPGDGILNIEMTIYNGKISIKVNDDTVMEDDYGFVKTQNNNNPYAWDEFEYGAYPGWDNYGADTMPYDFALTGC